MSTRASLIYLGTRVMTGLLSLVAISLFARGLGPNGYGWLTLATAVSAVSVAFLLQPVHHSLARFLSRAGYEDLIPTLARLLLYSIVVLLAVALMAETFAGAWLPLGVGFGAWALGSAQSLFDFSAQHANSTFRPSRYAFMYGIKSVLVVLLGYFALSIGADETGVLVAMCSSFVVAALLVNFECWKTAWFGRWSTKPLQPIKQYAVPLGATMFVSSVLSWGSHIILGAMLGSQAVGVFGVASDITQQVLGMLSGALYLAWYPRMLAASERKDEAELSRLSNSYASLVLFLMLPAALGFTLIRENLAGVMLGEPYIADSVVIIPWLSAAAMLAGLRTYLLEIPLHISGRMNVLLRNVALCAVWSIVLTVVLVDYFGLVGAGIAAVIAQATGCVLAITAGRGVLRWRLSPKNILAVLLGCSAMSITIPQIGQTGFVGLGLQLLIGMSFYVAVLWMFNVENSRGLVMALLRRAR